MPGQDTIRMLAPDGKTVWKIPSVNVDRARARGFTAVPAGTTENAAHASDPQWDLKTKASEMWGAANKPFVSADVISKGMGTGMDEKATNRFISEGNAPIRAGISSFVGGSKKSVSDLLSSFTSPVGLLLALAGAGESEVASPAIKAALRALQTGAGVGFGAQGAWNTIKKGPSGESTPDEIERRMTGFSQALLGATGAYRGTEIPRRATAREVLGVGNRSVEIAGKEAAQKTQGQMEDYASKVQEKKADFDARQAEKQAQYQAKKTAAAAKQQADIEATRKGYGESVAKAGRAKIQASRVETTKRSLSDLKDRLSEQATSNIVKAEQGEKAALDKRWGDFRNETQDVAVSWQPVQEAVVNAEENILKGSPENIAIFRNIMKEGEDPLLAQASVFKNRGRGGANIKDVFQSGKMVGPERERFLKGLKSQGIELPDEEVENPKEGASIPFDAARGFFTELGAKLYGREIPGDVYRAIKSVQEAVDLQAVKSLKAAKGDAAVEKYSQLKGDWSDYMRTWRDMRPINQGGSPLARIVKLAESPLAVKDRMSIYRDAGNQMLQKSGERISYLLARKKAFGADPSIPARLRATDSQLRSLPKSGGKVPEVKRPDFPREKEVAAPTRETFEPPTAPNVERFSPEEWRRQELIKKGKYLGSRLSGWDLIFPPRLLLERAASRALQNPSILDWLSGSTQ